MIRSPMIVRKRTPKFLADFALYKKHFPLVLIFLPVAVYFFIFKYIPMFGIVMAFKDFTIRLGIWGSPGCGLNNFEKVFKTATFIRSVNNTLIISGLKLLFGFPAPILLALMLNEVRSAFFKKTIQTVSYLPHFLSWVVLAGLLQQILSPNNGALNYLMQKLFGMKGSIYFLGDNRYFRGTLVVSDIWKGVGWSSVLYMATIASIDTSMYEAATVDGATRLQCTRYITLPCLIPTITIMLILNIGSILDAGFDQVFNLYNASVYKTGDIIDTYVYRYGFEKMEYSRGTAVGLFKNLIGFALVIGTNMITKRLSGDGIW